MRRATITLTDDLEALLAKHLAGVEAPPSLNVVMQAALRSYLGGGQRRRRGKVAAGPSFVGERAEEYDAGSRTTIELDAETERALGQAAAREGTTATQLAATLLRQYARGVGRPMPRGIGAYDSGRSDVASRAEELLWSEVKKARRP
jgi:hypothetical protein